jgi:hypothetical protein
MSTPQDTKGLFTEGSRPGSKALLMPHDPYVRAITGRAGVAEPTACGVESPCSLTPLPRPPEENPYFLGGALPQRRRHHLGHSHRPSAWLPFPPPPPRCRANRLVCKYVKRRRRPMPPPPPRRDQQGQELSPRQQQPQQQQQQQVRWDEHIMMILCSTALPPGLHGRTPIEAIMSSGSEHDPTPCVVPRARAFPPRCRCSRHTRRPPASAARCKRLRGSSARRWRRAGSTDTASPRPCERSSLAGVRPPD